MYYRLCLIDSSRSAALLARALTLAKDSVAPSTQRTYNSTWKKWIIFMQLHAHNPSESTINCTDVSQHNLLQLLLMFISYCLDVLQASPPSIPGVLSALRYNLRLRLANCDVFDNPLLTSIKAGVARIPYQSSRTRLPLTFEMVQWIIQQRTAPDQTLDGWMLATGVAMAYYLCLRASEYVSRTAVPQADSHQFDSESIEFTCTGSQHFVPSHLMHQYKWTDVTQIRFTIQHAKNIQAGHGVPIWFSTDESDADAVAFLQLVYLWSRKSSRRAADPFLSYRTADGSLQCLQYKTLQKAIKHCAIAFDLDPAWFNPHSVRMSGPTLAAAAGEQKQTIMVYGRWKSVPTSLIYQNSSTKSNNRMLRLLTNSTLFTATDVRNSHVLPPSSRQRRKTAVRK